jgi:succinate-acetate transporter protein
MKDIFKDLPKDMYKSLVCDSVWYKMREVYRDDEKLKALRMFLSFVGQVIGYMIVFSVVFTLFALLGTLTSTTMSFSTTVLLILLLSIMMTIHTIVLFEIIGGIVYVVNRAIKRRKEKKIK